MIQIAPSRYDDRTLDSAFGLRSCAADILATSDIFGRDLVRLRS